jgi:hypothetical protein
MAFRVLSSPVNTVEKYLEISCSLRQRAALPEHQPQRDQMLALAAHFERLADEVLNKYAGPVPTIASGPHQAALAA